MAFEEKYNMSDIKDTQMFSELIKTVDKEISLYIKGPTIEVRNRIPDTGAIPLEDPRHWFRIPDVICIFVDMLGSTLLSAKKYDQSTAKTYRLFTETAIQMFHYFNAPYIDVRGDGVFALFNQNQIYRALVAAVSFKTFADVEFTPRVKKETNLEIGTHIGIDQRTVLVKRVGLRKINGRTDRQNEVWAGRPVNMAAKLASLTKDGELLASDRFFSNLTHQRALYSCGCQNGQKGHESVKLWKDYDVSGPEYEYFDFDKAHVLESRWCEKHGKEYSTELLNADDRK